VLSFSHAAIIRPRDIRSRRATSAAAQCQVDGVRTAEFRRQSRLVFVVVPVGKPAQDFLHALEDLCGSPGIVPADNSLYRAYLRVVWIEARRPQQLIEVLCRFGLVKKSQKSLSQFRRRLKWQRPCPLKNTYLRRTRSRLQTFTRRLAIYRGRRRRFSSEQASGVLPFLTCSWNLHGHPRL